MPDPDQNPSNPRVRLNTDLPAMESCGMSESKKKMVGAVRFELTTF
jgi:hypothetical protein